MDILPLPNFFSEHDLLQMEQWCEKCAQLPHGTSSRLIDKTQESNDWTRHPHGKLKEEMNLFFKQRIEPLINSTGRLTLSFDFAFHGNQKPYGIHTDAGYDPQEVIFQQGIIPLSFEPKTSSVYTVILDQKCYHSTGFPNISAVSYTHLTLPTKA